MEFVFGWCFWLAFIGLFLAFAFAIDQVKPKKTSDKAAVALIVALLVMMGNLLTLGFSWRFSEDDQRTEKVKVSVCDAAQTFGFVSDQAYPVITGDGSVGSASVGQGSFETSILGGGGSITIKSQTELRLGFVYKGEPSLLILPINDKNHVVKFEQASAGEQPSIAIELNCKKKVNAQQVVHLGQPHLVFDSGLLRWGRSEVGRDAPQIVNKKFIKAGLAPVIQSYFDLITIRLTPEQFQRLL